MFVCVIDEFQQTLISVISGLALPVANRTFGNPSFRSKLKC